MELYNIEVLLILISTTIHHLKGEEAPHILESPSSILVPVNSVAVFVCKAYCTQMCDIDWNINETSTSHDFQKRRFIAVGFNFSQSETIAGIDNIYTSILSVNASLLVDNTKLYCIAVIHGRTTTLFSELVDNNIATLHVTSELLVNPNPLVVNQHTSLLLKWSPPYLWPGQHIKYYNVSTTNLRESTTSYDIKNATFNDLIITHEEFFEDQKCTEYKFKISAINNAEKVLQTFAVTGAYQRGSNESGTPSVNTTVYFSSTLTPNVRIIVQPPPGICYYQEFNYTITVRALNYSNEHDTLMIGPFCHHGNGSVRHDVMSEKLKVNEEYFMQLNILTHFETVTIVNHSFDTYFEGFKLSNPDIVLCRGTNELFTYKMATYVCGSFITIFLLITFTVILILFTHYGYWKQCRRAKSSTERAHDAMVHNPIYSGPVYESVRPELRTLSEERSSSTSSSNPCHSPSPNNNTSALQEKGNCYVDPPLRPQALAVVAVQTCNQQRSNSFVYSGQSHSTSLSVSDENNTLRSQSVSVTTSGRKGKERNKFHLTLSLGQDGNDSTSKKDVVSCVNPISLREVDENYAIMSPAGTVGGLLSLTPEDTEKYKE